MSQNVYVLDFRESSLNTSAISPCGNYIAITSNNGNVIIYKINPDFSMKYINYIISPGINNKTLSIKWFYDNEVFHNHLYPEQALQESTEVEKNSLRILSGSINGYIQIRDPLKIEERPILKIMSRLLSSEKGTTSLKRLKTYATIFSVDINKNKNYVVYGDVDNVIIRNIKDDSKPILTLKGHSAWVSSVSFSPVNNKIVSGSYDKSVCIWEPNFNTNTNKPLVTLKGHTKGVYTVAWSRDGNFIVSGSLDKTVIVWDATSYNIKFIFNGHTGAVISVAFSPDGNYIVSGSMDTYVKVWNTNNGALVKTMDNHKHSVLSVSWGVFRELQTQENPSGFPHPASQLPGQALRGSAEAYILSNSDRELIIWDFRSSNTNERIYIKNKSLPVKINNKDL
jgi:WD40 repeat protein